ncbi:MAG: acetylxylan esterase, partial [Lentisphaeria bacterium]|nr:acetylxylan esterase [Lentisphaeria bacterium]
MIEHPFPFDPSCGYTLEELQSLTAPNTEPADFADFWRGAYEETLAIDSGVELRPIWSPEPETSVFEVTFTSLGGVRIGAFVSRPSLSRGGMVLGHGYGGLSSAVLRSGMTVIAPCIRGFNLSSAVSSNSQAS